MTSMVQRFFHWVSSKREMPISRYRVMVSLAACGYLLYVAANNPVGPLAVTAVVLLTMFVADDCFRLLRPTRTKQEPPLSIR